MLTILDGPLDDLAFGEVHGVGYGLGKIDLPLLRLLSTDQLHLGGVTH